MLCALKAKPTLDSSFCLVDEPKIKDGGEDSYTELSLYVQISLRFVTIRYM